jgi:hypothetical protein
MNILFAICRNIFGYFWGNHLALPPPPPKQATRKSIPKKTRQMTWRAYHGDSRYGVCYACGMLLNSKNWHCSHVISDKRGGVATVDNLRTCCQHCNLSCGEQNLYAFIRDKKLTGPGSRHITSYMNKHPDQRDSKRSSNV